jgi:diaminopimelate decarboxylase
MKIVARPPAFTYTKNHLYADRVPLNFLAEKYGTPLYVYSASAIRDRFKTFDGAFKKIQHTICYAVKANSNLTLLKLLFKLGAGFDVVSGGELERVLYVNRKAAKKVVFSGVGKTAEEMDLALKSDILMFNVESESELDLLAERAAKQKRKARIALRVNPDVSAETHPYISTGLREHKFGVAIHEAADIYIHAARLKSLDVAGVSVHIGSQITNVEPFAAALSRIAKLVERLRDAGHNIRYVDAGGGLGIPYTGEEAESFDFQAKVRAYSDAIVSSVGPLKVQLLLEPGRSIVGPCGVLVSKVLVQKQNGTKRFMILDAAMNDLIRPALYKAHHDILPLQCTPADPQMKFDVVGPVCETGDFFARDRELPILREGEYVAIMDAGAYGMSLASNYNSRGRAAEILVDGNSAKVVRDRETIGDLLRNER